MPRRILIMATTALLGACGGSASSTNSGRPGTFVTLSPGSVLPTDDSGAINYISNVQNNLYNRVWLGQYF